MQKIFIVLGLAILLFGFFAEAEISSRFWPGSELQKESIIFPESKATILFEGDEIFSNFPIPAYLENQLIPESSNWNEMLISLSEYLKANDEKVLEITGFYFEKEEKTSIGGYASTGEARAGFLAGQLVELGISIPRIIVKDQVVSPNANASLSFKFYNDSPKIP